MGNLVWVFAVSASPLSVDRVAGVLAGVDGEAGDHAELRAPGKPRGADGGHWRARAPAPQGFMKFAPSQIAKGGWWAEVNMSDVKHMTNDCGLSSAPHKERAPIASCERHVFSLMCIPSECATLTCILHDLRFAPPSVPPSFGVARSASAWAVSSEKKV